MMRTVHIIFALAVLLAAASGAAATSPRAHSRASMAAAPHRKTPRAAAHAAAPPHGRAVGHGAGHGVARAARTRRRQNVNPCLAPPPRSSRARRAPYAAPPEPEPERPPEVKPAALRKGRVAMPPPLKGSYESLVRQNEKSEAEGLERIEDEQDLNDRIAGKQLVPVPASAVLAVNGNLPQNRRYCRSWTAVFLTDLARAHAALFHRPVEVSSAVRTVEYQKRLMGTNGNAAAAEGDIVSPHLTGATIDLAKDGLTRQELAWMRSWLLPLQRAGKIDVEEEFQQSCFHITVYKSYLPPKPARRAKAMAGGPALPEPAHAGERKPSQPETQRQRSAPPPEAAFAGQ